MNLLAQYPWIAGVCIAVTCGISGVFMKARRLTMLMGISSEIGLVVALIASGLGFSPVMGMGITMISSEMVMEKVLRHQRRRRLITGLIVTLTILIGLSSFELKNVANRFLMGDLSSSFGGISILSIGLLCCVLIQILFGYRRLAFDSFDKIGSQTQLGSVKLISRSFIISLVVTILLGTQIVGLIPVFVLLTFPATVGYLLGKTIPTILIVSVMTAVGGVILDWIASREMNWIPGLSVILSEIVTWAIVVTISRGRRD